LVDSRNSMADRMLLARRVIQPGVLVTLRAYLKFRAFVSPRAEVELGPNLQLGRGTTIGSFSKVKSAAGPLWIGQRVDVGAGVFISPGEAGIRIGDDCLISPHVSITGSNYRYELLDQTFREQGHSSAGIRIGANVWLGAGSRILDGAEIGSGVIVSPNAVVSGRIAENSIVQGDPGRVVFQRR